MAPRRFILLTILATGAAACGVEPSVRRTESWSADLTASDQVLIMAIDFDAAQVSGNGALSHLTNVDTQVLIISGTTAGDSLHLAYQRANLGPFRFAGRYAPQGLIGYLFDAEFDSVAVLFRRL
jgi:hypothetical protein